MRDEEEEKFDNLPEGLQKSKRGEAMQEAIEQLETACDNLDEAIDSRVGTDVSPSVTTIFHFFHLSPCAEQKSS